MPYIPPSCFVFPSLSVWSLFAGRNIVGVSWLIQSNACILFQARFQKTRTPEYRGVWMGKKNMCMVKQRCRSWVAICQKWAARSPGMLDVLRDHHRELLLHLGSSVVMAQLQPVGYGSWNLDGKLIQLSSFCMRKVQRSWKSTLTNWVPLCLIKSRIPSSSSTETLNQVDELVLFRVGL